MLRVSLDQRGVILHLPTVGQNGRGEASQLAQRKKYLQRHARAEAGKHGASGAQKARRLLQSKKMQIEHLLFDETGQSLFARRHIGRADALLGDGLGVLQRHVGQILVDKIVARTVGSQWREKIAKARLDGDGVWRPQIAAHVADGGSDDFLMHVGQADTSRGEQLDGCEDIQSRTGSDRAEGLDRRAAAPLAKKAEGRCRDMRDPVALQVVDARHIAVAGELNVKLRRDALGLVEMQIGSGGDGDGFLRGCGGAHRRPPLALAAPRRA